MLISISEVFETPVSVLLGETQTERPVDELKAISEKLEVVNLQLAQAKESKRKRWHWFFFILCALIALLAVILFLAQSPYLDWDYSDPELAVVGVCLHAFEFTFVRLAPLALLGSLAGMLLTRKKS